MSRRTNRNPMTKDRRRVEIIGLIITDNPKYSVADLCHHFRVEVATIQRDLNDLRSRGIPVHSTRGCLQLDRKLTDKELQSLLSLYVSSVGSTISHPKNVSLTVKKLKSRAIPLMASLVNAIETRQELSITYYKMFDDTTVMRTIEPYDLVPTNKDWRLIAMSDGYLKQFQVENIREVAITGQRFVRSKEYSSIDFFKNSFNYWRGPLEYDVVIRFSKEVAPVLMSELWTEDQEIVRLKDGSIELRMKTTALEQLGNWLMGWGGRFHAIRPRELKAIIKDKARSIIKEN